MPGAVHMFIPNTGQKVSPKWSLCDFTTRNQNWFSSAFYWYAESGKIPL